MRTPNRITLATAIGAAAVLLSTPSSSVDYRWTQGFGQGTFEAIIHNASGASLNIYCPSGQLDHTPGMFFETDKVRPRPKERIDVQVVVDGKNHAFYFDEIQFEARGRANLESLYDLIGDLVRTHSKTFTVEFPKFSNSETFSTLGAKAALGSAKEFLSGCM